MYFAVLFVLFYFIYGVGFFKTAILIVNNDTSFYMRLDVNKILSHSITINLHSDNSTPM